MKNLIPAIALIFGAAFIPMVSYSQNTTAQTETGAAKQTGADNDKLPAPNAVKQDDAGDAHYKVNKRNKKVGKMKYEMCETKEIEKGTKKGEIKVVCSPAK